MQLHDYVENYPNYPNVENYPNYPNVENYPNSYWASIVSG